MAIYLDSTKYCNIFLEQESFIDTYRMKLFPESRRSVNIQSIEIYSLKGMNIFDYIVHFRKHYYKNYQLDAKSALDF